MRQIIIIFLALATIGLLLFPSSGDNEKAQVTPDALTILAQGMTDIAEKSTDQDRETAHATPTPEPTPVPSEFVQAGQVWGWPMAVTLVLCGALLVLGIAAVLAILAWDRRTSVLAAQAVERKAATDTKTLDDSTQNVL